MVVALGLLIAGAVAGVAPLVIGTALNGGLATLVRYAADAGSERTMEIRAAGQSIPIWREPADGAVRSVPLPPLPAGSADLVLRSPPGRTTLWIDPIACKPRS